jgi:phosphatidylglycerol:prolipoprotein diacylglycerol transferase
MTILIAESYLHRLDPFAIHISGSFGVRWYGLAYAAGFLISWLIIRWMGRTGRSPLAPAAAGDLMFAIIAGVLVGGRVGYAVFYEPALLWTFTGDLPWWDLLAINKGGMASHGGMIGVIIAMMIFSHRHGITPLHLYDLAAFTCGPGLCLGRLANFINAELWGKALPAAMQADPPGWSVKYPAEITEVWWRTALDPAADPAAVAEASRRLDELEPLREVVSSSAGFPQHVVDAAIAGNETVIDHVTPLLTAYYPSQLVQAITDGPLLMAVLVVVWLAPRKPGVVGSWFLITYAALRIVSEAVRQPDEGVALLLGLSRGQALSVVMLAAGIVCLVIACRLPGEPIGGLLQPATAPPGSPERASG